MSPNVRKVPEPSIVKGYTISSVRNKCLHEEHFWFHF